jgi:hypothetical protein
LRVTASSFSERKTQSMGSSFTTYAHSFSFLLTASKLVF